MPRTTAALVIGILGDQYGPKRDQTLPDLTPMIAAANVFVNKAVALAARSPNFNLLGGIDDPGTQDSQAELLERYIAAHIYSFQDQIYASKSTAGASASFQGQTGMNLEGSKYGQWALRLDTTGTVEALDKRKIAGASWLGKPPSAQIPYSERN